MFPAFLIRSITQTTTCLRFKPYKLHLNTVDRGSFSRAQSNCPIMIAWILYFLFCGKPRGGGCILMMSSSTVMKIRILNGPITTLVTKTSTTLVTKTSTALVTKTSTWPRQTKVRFLAKMLGAKCLSLNKRLKNWDSTVTNCRPRPFGTTALGPHTFGP